MKIPRVFLALLVTAAAGCSSGPSAPPAAPTAVTADAAAASGDAARTAPINISGTVARVSGACPALQFLVGRVAVTTNRATAFTPGTCANVVNGAGVVATGSRQADGSLAAASIAVRGATSTR
jgi:hypothetical protein